MKSVSPALLLAACALSACHTPSNHHALYRPTEAKGAYTQALKDGTWSHGVKPLPVTSRQAAELAAQKEAQKEAEKPKKAATAS